MFHIFFHNLLICSSKLQFQLFQLLKRNVVGILSTSKKITPGGDSSVTQVRSMTSRHRTSSLQGSAGPTHFSRVNGREAAYSGGGKVDNEGLQTTGLGKEGWATVEGIWDCSRGASGAMSTVGAGGEVPSNFSLRLFSRMESLLRALSLSCLSTNSWSLAGRGRPLDIKDLASSSFSLCISL